MTGLDYFGARYYSPAQGRFVSPDPGNAGADLGNPQTWNGYAYVGNNPVNVTDPDGLGFFGDLWSVFQTAVGLYNTDGVQLNNTEPWNEMPPISAVSGGGLLNTGGIFGDGSTGPFINNILRADATLGSPNYNSYTEAIAYLMSDPRMAAFILQLQQSRRTYVVRFNRGGVNNAGINWDPLHSVYTKNGGCLSPAVGLAHELAHAAAADSDPAAYARRLAAFDPQYDNLEEKRVITGVEASVQRMLGGLPRSDHGADETKGIRGLEPTPGRSPVLAGCR